MPANLIPEADLAESNRASAFEALNTERKMTITARKFMLLTSLAMPLLSATAAYAGTIASDQRYWPNEVRSVQSGVSSALNAQASIDIPGSNSNACSYIGGPKTGTRVC